MAGLNPHSSSAETGNNGGGLEVTTILPPMTICEHLQRWKGMPKFSEKSFLDFEIRLCKNCEALRPRIPPKSIWVCADFKCRYAACNHSDPWNRHYRSTGHCVVIIFGEDRTLYCFRCRCRVHLDVLNSYVAPAATSLQFQKLFGIRGIVNGDNRSCFANVIIQVLVFTPYFRYYFRNVPKILCGEAHKQGKPCLITSVFQLFEQYYNGMTEPLDLNELLACFWQTMPDLGGRHQQDAHEFLTGLLEWIHLHFHPDPTKDDDASRGISVIDMVFGGKLQSTVTCRECQVGRVQTERFWNASLELPASLNGITLEDLLGRYTWLEPMEGCLTECTNCNRWTESWKQLQFRDLPPILCFQLKRFQHLEGGNIVKMGTHVQFPEMLNLTPFVSEDAKVNRNTVPGYHLYGVVVHRGSYSNGHYFCYIQLRDTNGNGVWFKMDDRTVDRVAREEVFESQAYLLFYHKSQPEVGFRKVENKD